MPIITPCSFLGDSLVMIDNPMGERHSSPKVITRSRAVNTLSEVMPLSSAKKRVA